MGRLASHLAYAIRTVILRQRRPYLFGLVITDACNLDCYYCESKNSGRYHYTADAARAALRAAYARGHRALYFTGGEPMLWTDDGCDLADMVRYARALGFHEVFVFTNGTVPLTIPACSYIVTLDGTRATHDRIRGGTYDAILRNVAQAGTTAVFASITFTKSNLSCLDTFVDEITALGLFRGISFNLLTHWPAVVAEHGVSGPARVALLDRLWALKQQGYPIVLSRAAYQALRNNDWARPIPLIELGTRDRVFACCRDVDNPSVCATCGYANCVEVSQILAWKPSAILQALRMVS